jgi:hypothetical protein
LLSKKELQPEAGRAQARSSAGRKCLGGGLRQAKKKTPTSGAFQVQHGFSIGSLEEFLL